MTLDICIITCLVHIVIYLFTYYTDTFSKMSTLLVIFTKFLLTKFTYLSTVLSFEENTTCLYRLFSFMTKFQILKQLEFLRTQNGNTHSIRTKYFVRPLMCTTFPPSSFRSRIGTTSYEPLYRTFTESSRDSVSRVDVIPILFKVKRPDSSSNIRHFLYSVTQYTLTTTNCKQRMFPL